VKTPEGYEKTEIKRYLDVIGAYHYWPVPVGYGQQGVDCYACIAGKFLAIEVKRLGKTPTPRQKKCLQDVAAAKGEAIWGDAKTVIGILSRAS
jgi:hypothetical protein